MSYKQALLSKYASTSNDYIVGLIASNIDDYKSSPDFLQLPMEKILPVLSRCQKIEAEYASIIVKNIMKFHNKDVKLSELIDAFDFSETEKETVKDIINITTSDSKLSRESSESFHKMEDLSSKIDIIMKKLEDFSVFEHRISKLEELINHYVSNAQKSNEQQDISTLDKMNELYSKYEEQQKFLMNIENMVESEVAVQIENALKKSRCQTYNIDQECPIPESFDSKLRETKSQNKAYTLDMKGSLNNETQICDIQSMNSFDKRSSSPNEHVCCLDNINLSKSDNETVESKHNMYAAANHPVKAYSVLNSPTKSSGSVGSPAISLRYTTGKELLLKRRNIPAKNSPTTHSTNFQTNNNSFVISPSTGIRRSRSPLERRKDPLYTITVAPGRRKQENRPSSPYKPSDGNTFSRDDGCVYLNMIETTYRTIKHDDVEKAKLLVEVNPALVGSVNSEGFGLLHTAAEKGQLDVVRAFVDNGSSSNEKDKFGYTPLHKAAAAGQYKVCEFLLERGASVNSRLSNGELPLNLAISNNQNHIVTLLKQKGSKEY